MLGTLVKLKLWLWFLDVRSIFKDKLFGGGS